MIKETRNGSVFSAVDIDVSPKTVVVPTSNQISDISKYTLWAFNGYTGYLNLDEALVTAEYSFQSCDSPAEVVYGDNETKRIARVVGNFLLIHVNH